MEALEVCCEGSTRKADYVCCILLCWFLQIFCKRWNCFSFNSLFYGRGGGGCKYTVKDICELILNLRDSFVTSVYGFWLDLFVSRDIGVLDLSFPSGVV